MQQAGNGLIDGNYHLICGSLAVTVTLQYSVLCVTRTLLEVTVKLQYSVLCVTRTLLEVTVKLQYSVLCVTGTLLEVTEITVF